MNEINKKQQDLEKEIEKRLTCPYCKKKLNKEWKCFHKENNKGIPIEYRISYDYLDKLQAELKGIKFAKKEMLKEMDAIIKKLESVCDDCEGHCNCFVQLFMKLGELRNG